MLLDPVLLHLDECVNAWDEFVANHPDGTIYHTALWKRILERSFRHIECKLFLVKDKRGEILGGLPIYLVSSYLLGKRLVSVPFGLFGGPLSKNREIEDKLILSAVQWLHNAKLKSIEIRLSPERHLHQDFQYSDFFKTHLLDITQPKDELLKNCKKNVFYGLKKAYKSNNVFEEACNKSDLSVFYNLLSRSRKRLGLPALPYTFFSNLWDALYDKGFLKLFFAKKHGDILGTHLVLLFKDVLYSEYKCSELTARRENVDYFLEWETILFAKKIGKKIYNFGRTAGDNKGLLFYKSRWGTVEKTIPIYFFPKNDGITSSEKGWHYIVVSKVLQRSPFFLYKLLSDLIYKHMG